MRIFTRNSIYFFVSIISLIIATFFTVHGLLQYTDDSWSIILKYAHYKDSIFVFFLAFLLLFFLNKLKLLSNRNAFILSLLLLPFFNSLLFLLFLIFFILTCLSLAYVFQKYLSVINNEYFLNFYLGYSLLIILLTAFTFFSINNILFYSIFFLLIIIFAHIHNKELYKLFMSQVIRNKNFSLSLFEMLFISLLAIYLFVCLMPEKGYDALAAHLYIPSYIKNYGYWAYNFQDYVWALMPLSGDLTISFFYMYGSEVFSKLSLFVFLIILLIVFYKTIENLGIKNKSLGILAILSCPIIFLQSTSLYIDIYWITSLMMILYVCVRAYKKNLKNYELYLVAFASLSISIKYISVLYLIVGLLIYFILSKKQMFQLLWRILSKPVNYIFIISGLFPYIHSLIKTGNPVFPFFNGFFESIFYAKTNFNNPLYNYNEYHRFLYDVTFNSQKFIEGGTGSFSFFWILFFIPMFFYYFIKKDSKKIFIYLFYFSILSLFTVFYFQSYLRYIAFVYILLVILLVRFYDIELSTNSKLPYAYKKYFNFLLFTSLFLNILHLNSATNYGYLSLDVLSDRHKLTTYQDKFIPVKSSVEKLNAYDSNFEKRVLFISAPQAGNLKGYALFLNWYNTTLLIDFIQSINSNNFRYFLDKYKVDYVILDEPRLQNNSLSISKHFQITGDRALVIIKSELSSINIDPSYLFKVNKN